jgi:hypothetical protein
MSIAEQQRVKELEKRVEALEAFVQRLAPSPVMVVAPPTQAIGFPAPQKLDAKRDTITLRARR